MKSRSTPAVPARRSPLPALALALLCACFTACSGPTYSLKRFQDYGDGARAAARELSKGNFIDVSTGKRRSILGVPYAEYYYTGSKPIRQLRQDITFTQYLHAKYKIKSLVLPNASGDFISGYHSVMTAALRERYGNDYYERAQKEFFPDWDKGDSSRMVHLR
ncbi:MAG: hypothetical protein ACYC67_10855 [Prosthecobacter sp.]